MLLLGAVVLSAAAVASALGASKASAPLPLRTAIFDPPAYTAADAPTAFARSMVRAR